jgi:hypothetical protein
VLGIKRWFYRKALGYEDGKYCEGGVLAYIDKGGSARKK